MKKITNILLTCIYLNHIKVCDLAPAAIL